MKQQKMDRFPRTMRRVERVRSIYSQIGEPLPVDILIELYQYLDKALELADAASPAPRKKRTLRM